MLNAVLSTATACTWNGAASHASTGSARVDLFYAASRGVDQQRLLALLNASWNENELDTLKIVAYCRDIRGGKGERLISRQMLTWLANHASAALAHNLRLYIAVFGRFDDVLALMGTPLEGDGLQLWADQLQADLKALNEGEGSISLVAKWIPSEKKSADKSSGVTKKLRKVLRCKDAGALRKIYLSPLRAKLNILERLMCAKEWDAINFAHVPSMAMKIHGRSGKAFERNLGDKFEEYKLKLATGEAKVNAKDLFPHQVIEPYLADNAKIDHLVESQWKVMLDKGAELGDLSNVLVMSDVSGSMSGLPMQISIALGILVSQLTSDEWRGLVLTFETAPRFHKVEGSSLLAQVRCLSGAPVGGSTNFQSALDLILSTAKNAGVPKNAMPKRLIVISDMQFNCADCGTTNYQALETKYKAAGYEVPHLVFWNVNGSSSDFPTTSAMPNVSLISGYSADILKAVLKGEDITPLTTMMNAINDERYDGITLPPAAVYI